MTQCMCVDVCVCIYIYIYTYVPIIVHMHTRVHTHVRARYHICACMHTCICTLRYSRIHAHDHLPVHTCLHVDFYRQTPVHIPTYIPSHEITSSASTLQEFLLHRNMLHGDCLLYWCPQTLELNQPPRRAGGIQQPHDI